MDQSYSVFQLVEAYKAYMVFFPLLRTHVSDLAWKMNKLHEAFFKTERQQEQQSAIRRSRAIGVNKNVLYVRHLRRRGTRGLMNGRRVRRCILINLQVS